MSLYCCLMGKMQLYNKIYSIKYTNKNIIKKVLGFSTNTIIIFQDGSRSFL